MKFLSSVVWSEGMYLGPHHFQAQSRFFEDSAQFATSALWFEPYGVAGVELDADALRNGTVSVVHARGIFPDGMPFDMPDSDGVPQARNIADLFPPTRDNLTILLAVPSRKPSGVNCATDGKDSATARYVAESRVFHDESSGIDEKPVRLGRKNIRLLLDVEPSENMSTVPLARITRDGSGHFVFDENFIPPCLRITASPRLMLLLRRLIEILEEKSSSLSRSPGDTRTMTEFSSREIASFWLLHSVNSSLAPLRHLWISKRGHPEELYMELARLAGALCTFSLDSHPRDLPLYDHEHLGETFNALDRHIRTHLETIVPTNCLSIPLQPTKDYFYEGEVTDQRCLGRSRWVFAIHSSAGEVEIISRTPHLVKICSADFVPRLVQQAIPGLGLTHLPVPPSAIPARVETHYFSIAKAGPCWEHLVKTKRVGVYVPGELPNPELELLVVLDT